MAVTEDARVRAEIVEGPVAPAAATHEAHRGASCGAGAALVFEGVVRPHETHDEDSRLLAALDYTAYEPMAQRQLEAIGRQVLAAHGLLAVEVTHSKGRVGVGETSVRLRVASAHRAEGLAAAAEFLDRMKRDAPIWKKPVFVD